MRAGVGIGRWDLFAVMTFVGVLLACAAQPQPVVPASTPPINVQLTNVELAPGATLQQAMDPQVRGVTPNVDGWVMGRGVQFNYNGPFFCGAPVVAKGQDGQTAHGRLIVYNVIQGGKGPAGKGNYLVQIPDSRISSTSGGRMTVTYEQYGAEGNDEYVAWLVYLGEQPLACN